MVTTDSNEANKAKPTGRGLFSMFGSSKKVKSANLGEENQMYYNKELKRWVERGKEDEVAKEVGEAAAPPIMAAPNLATLSQPTPGARKPINKRYVLQDNLSVSSNTPPTSATSLPPFGAPPPTSAAPPTFFMPQPIQSGAEQEGPAGDQGPKSTDGAFFAPPAAASPPSFFMPASAPTSTGYSSYADAWSKGVSAQDVWAGAVEAYPQTQEEEQQPEQEQEQQPQAGTDTQADEQQQQPVSEEPVPEEHSQAADAYSTYMQHQDPAHTYGAYDADAPPTAATTEPEPYSYEAAAGEPPVITTISTGEEGLAPQPTLAVFAAGPAATDAWQPGTPTPAAADMLLPPPPATMPPSVPPLQLGALAGSHQAPWQAPAPHATSSTTNYPPPPPVPYPFQDTSSSSTAAGTAHTHATQAAPSSQPSKSSRRRQAGAASVPDSDAGFDSVMHPGGVHKLDGPLPWELPTKLKKSNHFIQVCAEWQRQNPGVEYAPELLKAKPAGSPPPWASAATSPLGGVSQDLGGMNTARTAPVAGTGLLDSPTASTARAGPGVEEAQPGAGAVNGWSDGGGSWGDSSALHQQHAVPEATPVNSWAAAGGGGVAEGVGESAAAAAAGLDPRVSAHSKASTEHQQVFGVPELQPDQAAPSEVSVTADSHAAYGQPDNSNAWWGQQQQQEAVGYGYGDQQQAAYGEQQQAGAYADYTGSGNDYPQPDQVAAGWGDAALTFPPAPAEHTIQQQPSYGSAGGQPLSNRHSAAVSGAGDLAHRHSAAVSGAGDLAHRHSAAVSGAGVVEHPAHGHVAPASGGGATDQSGYSPYEGYDMTGPESIGQQPEVQVGGEAGGAQQPWQGVTSAQDSNAWWGQQQQQEAVGYGYGDQQQAAYGEQQQAGGYADYTGSGNDYPQPDQVAAGWGDAALTFPPAPAEHTIQQQPSYGSAGGQPLSNRHSAAVSGAGDLAHRHSAAVSGAGDLAHRHSAAVSAAGASAGVLSAQASLAQVQADHQSEAALSRRASTVKSAQHSAAAATGHQGDVAGQEERGAEPQAPEFNGTGDGAYGQIDAYAAYGQPDNSNAWWGQQQQQQETVGYGYGDQQQAAYGEQQQQAGAYADYTGSGNDYPQPDQVAAGWGDAALTFPPAPAEHTIQQQPSYGSAGAQPLSNRHSAAVSGAGDLAHRHSAAVSGAGDLAHRHSAAVSGAGDLAHRHSAAVSAAGDLAHRHSAAVSAAGASAGVLSAQASLVQVQADHQSEAALSRRASTVKSAQHSVSDTRHVSFEPPGVSPTSQPTTDLPAPPAWQHQEQHAVQVQVQVEQQLSQHLQQLDSVFTQRLSDLQAAFEQRQAAADAVLADRLAQLETSFAAQQAAAEACLANRLAQLEAAFTERQAAAEAALADRVAELAASVSSRQAQTEEVLVSKLVAVEASASQGHSSTQANVQEGMSRVEGAMAEAAQRLLDAHTDTQNKLAAEMERLSVVTNDMSNAAEQAFDQGMAKLDSFQATAQTELDTGLSQLRDVVSREVQELASRVEQRLTSLMGTLQVTAVQGSGSREDDTRQSLDTGAAAGADSDLEQLLLCLEDQKAAINNMAEALKEVNVDPTPFLERLSMNTVTLDADAMDGIDFEAWA